jgi:transcriptional antiterminator RfaH
LEREVSGNAEDYWLALYTQPHKERFVRDHLLGEGLDLYLPEVRNKVQRADRPSQRPFFPHYLFLRYPGAEKLAAVRWTPGVRSIVTFGDRPALIPDRVIQHIITRLRTYQLPEEEPFKPGQVVHIIDGPFEGMDAIFDRQLSSKGRVRVFFELVSRMQVSVEMDLKDLLPPD